MEDPGSGGALLARHLKRPEAAIPQTRGRTKRAPAPPAPAFLHRRADRPPGADRIMKRLRDADDLLTETILARLEEVASAQEGRPYGATFPWSDGRLLRELSRGSRGSLRGSPR